MKLKLGDKCWLKADGVAQVGTVPASHVLSLHGRPGRIAALWPDGETDVAFDLGPHGVQTHRVFRTSLADEEEWDQAQAKVQMLRIVSATAEQLREAKAQDALQAYYARVELAARAAAPHGQATVSFIEEEKPRQYLKDGFLTFRVEVNLVPDLPQFRAHDFEQIVRSLDVAPWHSPDDRCPEGHAHHTAEDYYRCQLEPHVLALFHEKQAEAGLSAAS